MGRIRISFTSTCGGCVSANITARAMSSASRAPARAVVEERRVDHAGLDQGHLDVGVRDLRAQRLAHGGHRVLGGRVERAGQRAAAGDRAGEDHVAAVLLPEVAERGADRERARRARSCRSSTSSAPRTPRGSRARRRSRRWRSRRPCGRSGRGPSATSACWSSQLVTSQRTAIAFSSPPSSSASAWSLSSERAASTTRWPNSTARCAVAAPMPVLAPVITRTGSSAMRRRLRCCARGARRPHRGSLSGRAGQGRATTRAST